MHLRNNRTLRTPSQVICQCPLDSLESFSSMAHKLHHDDDDDDDGSRRRLRCIPITAVSLLAVGILLLILGLTAFRPRHAVTTVNSVKLAGLDAGLDGASLSVDVNVTLSLNVTSTNPNHASFRYSEGVAELYYRGALVGEAAIPPGEIAAQRSVSTGVRLTVMAGRLVADSALYADVVAGSLPFTTTTRIPGRVTVLGIFKHHMVSYTTCDVTVSVATRSVENSDCRYKTKL